MKPKEQENQLSLSLNLRIISNLLIYFIYIGFIGYRLWAVSKVPSLLQVSSGVSVPSLKVNNFAILKESVKIKDSSSSALPVVRPEPFD